MDNEKDDFFNVGKVTDEWMQVLVAGKMEQEYKNLMLKVHLSIAQQLCVISGTLKRIGQLIEKRQGVERASR